MRTESQNVIKTFNVGLLSTVPFIFVLGLMTLYSATRGSFAIENLFRTQLVWFCFGLIVCIGIIFVDEQLLEKIAYILYGVCLVLLIFVTVMGESGGGSQLWLKLGMFRLQPSEMAKVALVFTFARYFQNEKEGSPYTLKRLILPVMLLLTYMALILKQPDMGTAGIVFFTAGSMVLFLRVHWKSFLIVLFLGLVTIPLSYHFLLKQYQRERVKTFLDPGRDPRGSGYNALQCKIAVGSGKIFGKGFMHGTQSQLNFIPEHHTDFIFAVFAEEWGFLGAVVLLMLYLLYLNFALRVVSQARGKFEMLLTFGLSAIFFWHVFVNVGMVSGILPIVGVTLPFFSYGGSSLVTFMISTALLLNLSRKRYIF